LNTKEIIAKAKAKSHYCFQIINKFRTKFRTKNSGKQILKYKTFFINIFD